MGESVDISDQRQADALGVSVDALRAERARKWDDACMAHVELMRPMAEERLLLRGWKCVYEGGDGLGCWDHPHLGLRIIHSVARENDGCRWGHVSMSLRSRRLPTWEQARDAFRMVYPGQYGVIVIAPDPNHVNRAEVMHVWCNLDNPTVPDFAWEGSI
jgi:hypothetical protein